MFHSETVGYGSAASLMVVKYWLYLLTRGISFYLLWSESSAGLLAPVMNLAVPSDLMALRDILVWLSQEVSPHLAPEQFWQVQLLIVEGFTNTVKYAHRGLPPITPIQIQLYPWAYGVEIHIWDFGRPFDLQRELNNRLSEPNPYSEHKQGLLLMSKTADGLDYLRVGDRRNCLIIHKILCWQKG